MIPDGLRLVLTKLSNYSTHHRQFDHHIQIFYHEFSDNGAVLPQFLIRMSPIPLLMKVLVKRFLLQWQKVVRLEENL